MHLVHLGVGVDLLTSMLQDITDDQTVFCATSRERRLAMAYESYKAWAEEAKVTDRAGQRLFTTSSLTNTKVVEVSQKVLNATACVPSTQRFASNLQVPGKQNIICLGINFFGTICKNIFCYT